MQGEPRLDPHGVEGGRFESSMFWPPAGTNIGRNLPRQRRHGVDDTASVRAGTHRLPGQRRREECLRVHISAEEMTNHGHERMFGKRRRITSTGLTLMSFASDDGGLTGPAMTPRALPRARKPSHRSCILQLPCTTSSVPAREAFSSDQPAHRPRYCAKPPTEGV